jgi:hypothetical protein
VNGNEVLRDTENNFGTYLRDENGRLSDNY